MGYRIPGLENEVENSTPILPNGNFTWGEATKSGSRIPLNETITGNIQRVAKVMQEIRERFGDKPITVTSWYRPPAINRAVNGASNSQHIQGHAVDFIVQGVAPLDVYAELDDWWVGGLGKNVAFTHIDMRGSKARWNYGS